MPISEKTRKILWGRSGNRCAVCRVELTIDETVLDAASVVGEECHIVSGQRQGPRHNPQFPAEMLHSPENLVLLCRVHHKMIDDQQETYTVDVLAQLKLNHERWVAESLESQTPTPRVRIKRIPGNAPSHLIRLRTGADILSLKRGTFAAALENDEPADETEANLIGAFVQDVQDWGDLIDGMEAGEQVRAAFRLSASITELEEAGFWVFGAREVQRIEGGIEPPSPWPILHLCVLRKDSPRIQEVKREGKQVGDAE